MNFHSWTHALAARGFRVLPPSHPVPVELWAVLPGGDVVHFRCRGTTATLARYDGDDVRTITPTDGCPCDCAARAGAGTTTPRVLARPGVRPREVRHFDGRAQRGWTSYEAGLLTVAEAAELFDHLLGEPHTATERHGAEPVVRERQLVASGA